MRTYLNPSKVVGRGPKAQNNKQDTVSKDFSYPNFKHLSNVIIISLIANERAYTECEHTHKQSHDHAQLMQDENGVLEETEMLQKSN